MANLKEELLKNIDGFIFDLDGVIWRGKAGIPYAKEAVDVLRAANKKVLFVTNNASETRGFQRQKLINLGIECAPSEFLTSGYATALHLSRMPNLKNVHVMGSEQLKEEFQNFNFNLVDVNAQAVVVGLDKEFSYKKLNVAFQNLYRKDCMFVACNKNPIYPTENGFQPGVGVSVAALENCTGKLPDLVVGKPESIILDIAMGLIGTERSTTMVFGDILDMDIVWGQRGGLKTCYVLSGVGTREDITKLGIEPDYVSESVGTAFGVC